MRQPIPSIAEALRIYTEFTGLHPIAEIFPMKSEEEFADLVRHIEANGVVEKILREKGTGLLVDGRNRLLACSITHSLFEIEDIDSEFILMTVTAKNLHAKQFSASQRSTIANDLRPFYDEKAKDRQHVGRPKELQEKIPEHKEGPHARDEAGKVAGVNAKYVDMARDVSLVDANQLGRRNLTGDQASILRGRRYNRTKKTMAQAGAEKALDKMSEASVITAQSLGKQHGVTERTIRRDGKMAQALEKLAETRPEAAQAVMDGSKRFNEVRREIKLAEVQPEAAPRMLFGVNPFFTLALTQKISRLEV